MEYTRMTWLEIMKITAFSPDKLVERFILPSFKFSSQPLSTQDLASIKKDSSDFIAGKDLKLSMKMLKKYCDATKKNETAPDGTPLDFFCTGMEFKGLSSAFECWKKYDEELSDSYGKRSIEYKSITQQLRNLIKPPVPIKFTHSDGTVFDMNICLQSILNDTFSYQLAVYSIIATTWPVWELVATHGKDEITDHYNLDRDSLCKMLKTLSQAITPHRITLSNILDGLDPTCTQLDFVEKILKKCTAAKDYENTAVINDNTFHFSKSDLSRLFNGKLLKRSKDFLRILTLPDVTRESFSGRLLRYQEYPCLKNLRSAWEAYLKDHPASRASLCAVMSKYYESFEKDNWIIRFSCEDQFVDLIAELNSIKEEPSYWEKSDGDFFIYKLSVFSIIAATWAVWEKCNDIYSTEKHILDTPGKTDDVGRYRILLRTLVNLIFPETSAAPQSSASPSEEYTSDNAEQLLEDARSLFENSDEYTAAEEKLIDIICHYSSIASNETLRQTYDLLIKCRQRGYPTPDWLGSLDNIKAEAEYYGTTALNKKSHEIKSIRKKSYSAEAGYYYIKCSNKVISSWINSTIPANWRPLTLLLEKSVAQKKDCQTPEDIFEQTDFLYNNIRFVFAEDTFEQNVNDALSILDRLQKLTDKGISRPELWGCIEIVIRCEQEKVSPLLDTACSFLDQTDDDGTPVFAKNPIRIHLLDEKKRAADLLYARHPLFYPLTLPRNKDNIEKHTFNLVIISDNEDISYAIWLIRQAFWLLPHTKTDIRSKIILLSPYYKRIANRISLLCPGFAQFSKADDIPLGCSEQIKIDDISFPEIEYRKLQMDSLDLERFVKSEISSENLAYYVIDAASDFEGINLGIRIREISIRKALKKKQLKYYTSDETVIAVRCSDPDYANLAKQLLVPKEEEHDNRWFNDYKLISFGTVKDIFSWDELTGGIIEFMSECIHFQYCTKPDEHYDYSAEPPDEFIWSYYRRFYNRDSSYAAAMSLPYRLYEADVLLRPSEWVFSDPEAFWSKADRNILADRFSKITVKESLYRWEHSRFCCYLLSTGWLPASPELARYYMNHDVSRHVLQIGRLHPCLCSWDDLVFLSIVLHDAYVGAKDSYGEYSKHNDKFKNFVDEDYDRFQKLDKDNILQTADILRAEPLPWRRRIIESEYDRETM